MAERYSYSRLLNVSKVMEATSAVENRDVSSGLVSNIRLGPKCLTMEVLLKRKA